MTTPTERPGDKRKIKAPKSPKPSISPSTPKWAAVNHLPASDILNIKSIPLPVTPTKRRKEEPSSKPEGVTTNKDEPAQHRDGLDARVTKRLPVREKKVMRSIEVHDSLSSSDAASSSGFEYEDEQHRSTTAPKIDHEPPPKKQRVVKGPSLKDDAAGWFAQRSHKGRYTKKDLKEMQDALRRARYGTANPSRPTQEQAEALHHALTAKIKADEESKIRETNPVQKRVSKSTHPSSAEQESSRSAVTQSPPPGSSPAHTEPAAALGDAAGDIEDVAVCVSTDAIQASTPAGPSNNAEPASWSHHHAIPEQSAEVKREEREVGGPMALSSERQTPPEGYIWNMAGTNWITESQFQLKAAEGKIAALEKRLEVDGIELQHQLAHEAEMIKKDLSKKAGEHHKDSGETGKAVPSNEDTRKEGGPSGKLRRLQKWRQCQKERKKAKQRLKHAELTKNGATGMRGKPKQEGAIETGSESSKWSCGNTRPELPGGDQNKRVQRDFVAKGSKSAIDSRRPKWGSSKGIWSVEQREEGMWRRGFRPPRNGLGPPTCLLSATTKSQSQVRVDTSLTQSQQTNTQVVSATVASPNTAPQSQKWPRRGRVSSTANDASSCSLSANHGDIGKLQPAMRDGRQESATGQETSKSTATMHSDSHPPSKDDTLAQGTRQDDQTPVKASSALCVTQAATNKGKESLDIKRIDPKHPLSNQGRHEMQRRGTHDRSNRQWQRPYDRREVIIPEVLPRCVCQLLHFYFESGLNKKPSLEAFSGTREEFFANVEQIVQCHGHDKEMILFCEGLWEIEKVDRKVSAHSSGEH